MNAPLCALRTSVVVVFLSLSNINSSIFIRQGANWMWDCSDAARLAFSENFKVMLLGFVIATGGWVGLRSHYNASHRGTVERREQPSWRPERNRLVCASEKTGAGGGIFLLLRKWCSAPVVRGQNKSAAFCTDAASLACFCSLRTHSNVLMLLRVRALTTVFLPH